MIKRYSPVKVVLEVFKWARPEIFNLTLLFFLSIALSALIYSLFINDPDLVKRILEPLFADLLDDREKWTYFSVFVDILERNITATLTMAGLGIIHRVFPKLLLFANGLVIGLALGLSLSLPNGLQLFILSTIFHGVFEIPALILAATIGVKLTSLSHEKTISGRAAEFGKLIKPLFTVFGLLFIAGLIEAALIITD